MGGFIAYDISVFSICNAVHRIWIPHKPPLCDNINGCVSQCCISAHKRPSSTPTYKSTSLVYQQTLPKVMTKFVLVAICLKTMPTSHMFERVNVLWCAACVESEVFPREQQLNRALFRAGRTGLARPWLFFSVMMMHSRLLSASDSSTHPTTTGSMCRDGSSGFSKTIGTFYEEACCRYVEFVNRSNHTKFCVWKMHRPA